MDHRAVKSTVILPLAILLGLVLCSFVVGAYMRDRQRIRDEVEASVARIEGIRKSHMDEDFRTMNSELNVLTREDRLRSAMTARDRQALLELSAPLFARLQTGIEITHLYFTDADRVNVLRVHKPDTYGDVIDRVTTLEAERTKQPVEGLELGPLGTLTMRVVHPWYEDDRLIGYLELGHEKNRMIELLSGILDLEIRALLRKEHLDRGGWESGMRMLDREGEWERFRDVVLTSRLPEGLSEDVCALLVRHDVDDVPERFERTSGDRRYRVALLPLNDAGGRDIGRLLVLRDVTDRLAASTRYVLSTTLVGIIAVGALIGVLIISLGRFERRLRTSA